MNKGPGHDYRRLLLIDDEPGIRRMMRLSLAEDGYQVMTAAGGAEGLDLFESQKPDIVLTDIKMPGMDGIEVLKRIKEMSPGTEVIVITGHGDLDLAIKSLQLEASDFVTKPVSEAALAVALKRAAQRLAMRAELDSYINGLEQKVAEAMVKALAMERLSAVGQTVSSLVHSIKNMLAGLKGGTYLVGQGLEQDRRELMDQGLEMLGRNVRRVEDLVGDLMAISKPRHPEMEACDPAAVAREVLDLMAPEAGDKEVALDFVPPAKHVQVQLDRKMICDALCNLVSNAVDAASTVSGGRVQLAVMPKNGWLAFQVADNGPGLDQEDEARIFEGFYSTKGAAGTGLGLMVAQKSAQEHGGRVEYDNRPGKGATFRLVLPVAGKKDSAPA